MHAGVRRANATTNEVGSEDQDMSQPIDPSPMNALFIGGIRSHYVKLAALQTAVGLWNSSHQPRINASYVNTGQHYDYELAGGIIQDLGLRFDHDLTGTYSSTLPARLASEMTWKLYELMVAQPSLNWAIVFGDANTTLAGALAAAKAGIPLAHVEAGLRTGWPRTTEEINRVVTDHLATTLFVTACANKRNLAQEGLTPRTVWSGDVVRELVEELARQATPGLAGVSDGYVLATLHRAENLASRETMRSVIDVLGRLDRPVALVAHPRTRRTLREYGIRASENVTIRDGLGYRDMLAAITGSAYVFTDSGGLQREAYYLRKRCVIRQDEVGWPSLTEAGVHTAVGRDRAGIVAGLQWAERTISTQDYPTIADFGDGDASMRILSHLVRDRMVAREGAHSSGGGGDGGSSTAGP